MTLTKENVGLLEKFNFDLPPVGVKFLSKPPDMVGRIEENMAFLRNAQEGTARRCFLCRR